MTGQLMIRLARSEGALVRLLGLAERRGFAPVRVLASPDGLDSQRVLLTVSGQRPLDKLTLQLSKLYDVLDVETMQ